MNDATRRPEDEQLFERFFERQRHEILHRVAQRESDRRFRRSLLALAASAALVALLLGGGLLGGPSSPPATLALVEGEALLDPLPGEGALAHYGAWDETSARAAGGGVESPLPPLALELDDELLDEIDFDPFLPTDSGAHDALAS